MSPPPKRDLACYSLRCTPLVREIRPDPRSASKGSCPASETSCFFPRGPVRALDIARSAAYCTQTIVVKKPIGCGQARNQQALARRPGLTRTYPHAMGFYHYADS